MQTERKSNAELAREAEALENLTHERAVVGVMLQDPTLVTEILAIADAEMFDSLDMRKAFEGLVDLHSTGFSLRDSNVVGARLLSIGVSPDQCTLAAIHKLKNGPNPGDRLFYLEELRRAWLKRSIVKLAGKALERAETTKNPESDIAWLESQLGFLVSGGRGLESRAAEFIADDVLAELAESVASSNRPGVMTGIYELDEHLGPIMPGELAVVAARPGQGKTALAMQIAQHVATRGQVLFVSLEMRDRELLRRALASMSGVEGKKMRSGEVSQQEFDLLRAARLELSGLPLEICSPGRATMLQIAGIAKYRRTLRGELRMILVDYIGLIRAAGNERGMERHLQIGEYTSALKVLGKEIGCPVVALAQLNRDAQNKPPTLANLRESGSIEQDADVVLMIHHPSDDSKAHLMIAKHRHGKATIVRVKWNPSTTSFGEVYTEPYGGREWTG